VFSDARRARRSRRSCNPEVYRRIGEWFVNLPSGTGVAIADIPLLFETGHHHDFDCVIVCACAPEEQVRRVMARDRLGESDARARLAAQWPIGEKVARAAHVIWTDRGFAETDAQVADTYRAMQAKR
jgi:dephospho-CoA kinase